MAGPEQMDRESHASTGSSWARTLAGMLKVKKAPDVESTSSRVRTMAESFKATGVAVASWTGATDRVAVAVAVAVVLDEEAVGVGWSCCCALVKGKSRQRKSRVNRARDADIAIDL